MTSVQYVHVSGSSNHFVAPGLYYSNAARSRTTSNIKCASRYEYDDLCRIPYEYTNRQRPWYYLFVTPEILKQDEPSLLELYLYNQRIKKLILGNLNE